VGSPRMRVDSLRMLGDLGAVAGALTISTVPAQDGFHG